MMNIFHKTKYLAIVFLTVGAVAISGYVLFNQSINLIEENTKKSEMYQLNNYIAESESNIETIRCIMDQLSKNQYVLSMMYKDNPLNDSKLLYDFENINNLLASYISSNRLIDNIYLNYKENNVSFISNHLLLRDNQAYDKYLTYNKLSAEDWNQLIYKKNYYQTFLPACPVTLDGQTQDSIVLIHSIPNSITVSPKGVIAIFINKEKFIHGISTLADVYHGYGYIRTDSDFISTNPDIDSYSNNSNMLDINIKSDTTNWTYGLVVSKDDLFKKVNNFRYIGIILIVISAVSSLSILCMFVLKKSSMIKNIVSQFNQYQNNQNKNNDDLQDNLNYIKKNVSVLLKDNTSLKERSEEYQNILISNFWVNLLRGNISEIQKADYYLMQIKDVNLENNLVTVAIKLIVENKEINKNTLSQMQQIKSKLREIFEKTINGYIAFCDMSFDRVGIIYSSSANNPENILIIDRINEEIKQQFDFEFKYSMGEPVDNIDDLAYSYTNAINIIENKSNENLVYLYTVSDQLKLLDLVKEKNNSDSVAYLNNLTENYFSKHSHDKNNEMKVIHDLSFLMIFIYNTLKSDKQINYIPIYDLMQRIYLLPTFKEQYAEYKKLTEDLCNSVLSSSSSDKNMILIENIQDFVQKNISNYNLTLDLIADKFNFSKAYLSNFYSEKSGVKLSVYIEILRIEKSCELLKRRENNILLVSQQVGYSTPQVFRRAFKRVKGVSPTEYISELRRLQ